MKRLLSCFVFLILTRGGGEDVLPLGGQASGWPRQQHSVAEPYRGVAVAMQRGLAADGLIHLIEQSRVPGKEAPVPEDKESERTALGRTIARGQVLDVCDGPLDQGGQRAGRRRPGSMIARGLVGSPSQLEGERPLNQGFKASPGPSKEGTTDSITQRIQVGSSG